MFGMRVVKSILEHVAWAMEREVPAYRQELLSESEGDRGGTRLYRLTPPRGVAVVTDDEPAYVLVTARHMTAEEARRFMPGGTGDPDTTAAGRNQPPGDVYPADWRFRQQLEAARNEVINSWADRG